MAGQDYQILCHSIGVLSFFIACVFIITGVCLQVFDPEDDTKNPLPWRTDGLVLIFIGTAALIVFIIYFCHVARRQWKIFNVFRIRPHFKRRNTTEVGEWQNDARQRHACEKSPDAEDIDGITPAQAYSREFSLEETESSVSEHSQKQLVRSKPPRQGKYRLPRQTSEISDESDNMEIVPVNKTKIDSKIQRPRKKRAGGSPHSTIKDYMIRSSQRYSINEPKRDERVEAKAKADRKLMESLENKEADNYVIQPSRKSFRKNVQINGGIPNQRPKAGIDNEAYVIQPRETQTTARDSKKYPNGILKKSSTDGDDTHFSDDEYVVQSKRQRKFQKRAHGAMRHSSQKVNAGGADENSLDKPSWVVNNK